MRGWKLASRVDRDELGVRLVVVDVGCGPSTGDRWESVIGAAT